MGELKSVKYHIKCFLFITKRNNRLKHLYAIDVFFLCSVINTRASFSFSIIQGIFMDQCKTMRSLTSELFHMSIEVGVTSW